MVEEHERAGPRIVTSPVAPDRRPPMVGEALVVAFLGDQAQPHAFGYCRRSQATVGGLADRITLVAGRACCRQRGGDEDRDQTGPGTARAPPSVHGRLLVDVRERRFGRSSSPLAGVAIHRGQGKRFRGNVFPRVERPVGGDQSELDEEVVRVVRLARVDDVPGVDLQRVVLDARHRASRTHLVATERAATLLRLRLQRGPDSPTP